MSHRPFSILAFALGLLLFSAEALAQSVEISGTVTDSGGARFETTRHTVDTGDAVVFGGCKESFVFCTDDEKED